MLRAVRGWVVVAAVLLGTPAAFAHDVGRTYAPRNLIDINPLSLLFGKLSIEYERAFSGGVSGIIGPQLLLYRDPLSGPGPAVFGYGLSLGVHFFPGGEAIHGFWIGPEANLGLINSGANAGVYGQLNGILGYTFLPTDHFAISLGIGGGYRFSNIDFGSGTANYNGFGLTGRAAIGYAW